MTCAITITPFIITVITAITDIAITFVYGHHIHQTCNNCCHFMLSLPRHHFYLKYSQPQHAVTIINATISTTTALVSTSTMADIVDTTITVIITLIPLSHPPKLQLLTSIISYPFHNFSSSTKL